MKRIRSALSAAIVAMCAAASPAATLPASQNCEYRNAYVEPDSAMVSAHGRDAIEPLRRRILASWADAAREVGILVVDDRDDAWLRLQVSAFLTDAGSPYVRFDLTPYLKLQHHAFIAVMDDPNFPSGGRLGAAFGLELNPFPHDDELERSVRGAMHVVWNRTSVEIDALCALRERLVEEGWTELEELRKQLLLDMERVRAARRAETQRKKLDLRIEE